MNFSDVFLVILMLEPTGTSLYGMFLGKGWFWNPRKHSSLHPILSWRWNYNYYLGRWFGRNGIIIFNILYLTLMWIGGVFLIIYGTSSSG